MASFGSADDVALVATHPAYQASTQLAPPVREELFNDLLGTTKALSLG